MGVSRRICSENKVELRELKAKAVRILGFQKEYPNMNIERRMSLTVKLNEIMERAEYLRRDKNANVRVNDPSDYDFQYVFKKERVKNRKA